MFIWSCEEEYCLKKIICEFFSFQYVFFSTYNKYNHLFGPWKHRSCMICMWGKVFGKSALKYEGVTAYWQNQYPLSLWDYMPTCWKVHVVTIYSYTSPSRPVLCLVNSVRATLLYCTYSTHTLSYFNTCLLFDM